ncbi:DUF2752 domain-containing protein [Occultella glacieicola]|uniref:DUF2752 domain-containing protein n=1 Tax=Occultella glacieicola TaxID=2518684 RepID=A0ABY2E1X0_9MICO|nr:DUF2752 domain-containing protein [Occultella glacieicola]TDE90377.1 DUF2752 domain-containing protein [Occultella glacieicola]
MSVEATAPTRDRRPPVLIGAGVAAATVLLALVDPHDGGYGFCPMLRLTGWFCPFCGGLRTTHALATGDLAGAWAANPVLAIVLPLAALGWLWWLVRVWRSAPARPLPGWVAPVVGAGLLGFTLLRNLPAFAPYLSPL